MAAEVQANLRNLRPASRDAIVIALSPCLALVAGSGMGDEARDEWLIAAAETLKGIPDDLLRRGCDFAKRKADHPSKIIPALMSEVEDAWKWRRAQASAPLDSRHVPLEPRTCTPEEAADICARYKVGSHTVARSVDPSRPAAVPTTADPERPCRAPTREDYIRLFGIDPEATTTHQQGEAA